MKEALFYTFLSIFAATAIVTLLGVAKKLTIDKRHLDKLFAALLLELIAAVITLFVSIGTSFFDDNPESGPCRGEECVTIDRVADFRENHCTVEGKKHDRVFFYDTYEINTITGEYILRADQPSGNLRLKVFDMNSGQYLNPYDTYACPGITCKDLYKAKVIDSKVKIRWEWTNGHLDAEGNGLRVKPRMKLMSFYPHVTFPAKSNVTDYKFGGEDEAVAKCDKRTRRCEQVFTNDKPIEFTWKWDIWKGCEEGEPAL